MATECINLKWMQTPRYRTYRLTQSSGVWLKFYQERIKTYGKYNALIFPEMYLGLDESTILYSAAVVDNRNGLNFTINVTKNTVPHLLTQDRVQLTKTSDIQDYESENNIVDSMKNLKLSNSKEIKSTLSYNIPAFCDTIPLFTNKRDLRRYTSDLLEEGFNLL